MSPEQRRAERARQDQVISQSESAKRRKEAHDIIEDLDLASKIQMNDRDYFEQLYKDVSQ